MPHNLRAQDNTVDSSPDSRASLIRSKRAFLRRPTSRIASTTPDNFRSPLPFMLIAAPGPLPLFFNRRFSESGGGCSNEQNPPTSFRKPRDRLKSRQSLCLEQK